MSQKYGITVVRNPLKFHQTITMGYDCCWDSTCWPCWKKRSNWEVACGVQTSPDWRSRELGELGELGELEHAWYCLMDHRLEFVLFFLSCWISIDQWMIAYWKVAPCQYVIYIYSDQQHPATNSSLAQGCCFFNQQFCQNKYWLKYEYMAATTAT